MPRILPQNEHDVKQCADEWCSEDIFRDGLCFGHFVEVETQEWDAWNADRQAVTEALA